MGNCSGSVVWLALSRPAPARPPRILPDPREAGGGAQGPSGGRDGCEAGRGSWRRARREAGPSSALLHSQSQSPPPPYTSRPCPEQRAPRENASDIQRTCDMPVSSRGGVLWCGLFRDMYVSILKVFHDGAWQKVMPVFKQPKKLGFLCSAVTWASLLKFYTPFSVSRSSASDGRRHSIHQPHAPSRGGDRPPFPNSWRTGRISQETNLLHCMLLHQWQLCDSHSSYHQ